ncbi:hypothetical protein HPB50_010587 [Hyalomma asiaticum]|uniref:Uncharacterized protein n=1 Tax=Hyalomma asiaticum TaxID=266040 RepID=A0ACB7RU35_HYAAI|nr:hypothetical protein HPB50_010587 [Hyalomma asiaticum]
MECVRQYFTEQEWVELPEYMKSRYANIKENYDKMIALGLQPPVPEFMTRKPAARKVPAKSSSSGPSGLNAKRTSRVSQPESRTYGKSPVRRSTRVQEKTGKTSAHNDTKAKSSSTTRYPKRNRDNVDYTEDEDVSEDYSPPTKARAVIARPRPARKLPVKRPENRASGIEYKCRDGCSREQPSECPSHGPSFYTHGVPLEDFERAKASLPEGLVVLRSKIKGAQLGIFTLGQLPEGHLFGPYAHSSLKKREKNQATDQEVGEEESAKTGDATPETAWWIRYVNCASSERHCNLSVLEESGFVYYQISRPVEPSAELLLWCGVQSRQASTVGMPSWRTAFICEICGCCSSSKWQLDKHRETAHLSPPCDLLNQKSRESTKSFVCKVCRAAFLKQPGLDRHMLTHISAKPFKCEECGLGFNQEVLLKRHQKLHTGGLMYECSDCDRKFSMLTHFKSHCHSHLGLKPYSCRVCGRAFARRCHCAKHEITMHGKH